MAVGSANVGHGYSGITYYWHAQISLIISYYNLTWFNICETKVKKFRTLFTKSALQENLTYPNKKISKNLAGDHLFSTAGWLGANRGNLNCFTACTNRQLCPWHHTYIVGVFANTYVSDNWAIVNFLFLIYLYPLF